ncbi:unnamed protein product [Prorocentrum cordatum]|uniref:Subtilisin n=1 Tax=Prorocentrum cordatum TaxID=2364126 RepID=A0ABN9Y7J4_9DINO|nr:unnamed protein product [Polarella glacialis]
MRLSETYSCAAPCRAMRILMAIVASILPGTPFATGVFGSNRPLEFLACDVFMLQASVDLPPEVHNRTKRPKLWARSRSPPRHHRTPFSALSTWKQVSAQKHAVATPSPTSCVDSAMGATNRFGKGCEVYSHDYENPFSGICFDPYYDDSDFTSASMCCVCPEECPDLPRIRLQDNCEDWISFSDLNSDGETPGRSHHSNLGGMGPQFQMPNELRYYGVGQTADGSPLDITFINTTEYVPRNTNWNNILGATATVNLLVGQSVTLKGEFVRNHTFCSESPVRPKITFCDVDHFKDGENEIVLLDGISAVYTVDGDIDFDMQLYEYDTITSNSPAPLAYTTTSVQTPIPGRSSRKYVANAGGKFGIKVTSEMFGHGCDNPADPNSLSNVTCPDASAATVDQAKRCFMVEFANTTEFIVGFKILTDMPPQYVQMWGRNFAMSGTSNYFVDEDSVACFTTFAPTSSPTSSPTLLPTASPTASPTVAPTGSPTAAPTAAPTGAPTSAPTATPTASPTASPTAAPTAAPTSRAHSCTDCGTDSFSDSVTDCCPDGCANKCAHSFTDSGTDSVTDSVTDCCPDGCTNKCAHARTDSGTDSFTDRVTDCCPDGCANKCAHSCTDSGTNSVTDSVTDCCPDGCTNKRAHSCTDIDSNSFTDRVTDCCPDGCTDKRAHSCTDSGTDSVTDRVTDSVTVCSPDGCPNFRTDRTAGERVWRPTPGQRAGAALRRAESRRPRPAQRAHAGEPVAGAGARGGRRPAGGWRLRGDVLHENQHYGQVGRGQGPQARTWQRTYV